MTVEEVEEDDVEQTVSGDGCATAIGYMCTTTVVIVVIIVYAFHGPLSTLISSLAK